MCTLRSSTGAWRHPKVPIGWNLPCRLARTPSADFTIVDSPELVAALRTLARRYQRAIDTSPQAPG